MNKLLSALIVVMLLRCSVEAGKAEGKFDIANPTNSPVSLELKQGKTTARKNTYIALIATNLSTETISGISIRADVYTPKGEFKGYVGQSFNIELLPKGRGLVSYAIPVGKLSVEPQDKVKIMAAEIRGTHIDWKLEEPKNAMPNYLSSAIMPMTFQQSAAGCEEKCWAKCDAAYAICEGKCLQSGIESFSCDCSCSGSGVRISTHCKCMPIPH